MSKPELEELKYHIKLNKTLLKGAVTAILPGDPGRVEKTARMIDPNPIFLAQNREYTSWLALSGDKYVLVCSTGIGGPSVSICVEELAAIGVTNFIRIGTTGAIQDHVKLADIIVTTGAVRLDGASLHYAPMCYPAVADFDLTAALLQATKELGVPHHKGITASSDTFYPGQERYDTFSGYVPRNFQGSLQEWKNLNVLNYEMEAATLYTICNAFGLKGAMIASVIATRGSSEVPDDTILPLAEERLAQCIKKAVTLI